MSSFIIDPPKLGNTYLEDVALLDILDRFIFSKANTSTQAREAEQVVKKDLTEFGDKVSSTIWKVSDLAERHEPQLIHYDAWQNRIDHIELHPAWKQLTAISATEGVVSIGYQREKFGEYARIYQFAKLYLFDPSSSVFTCPLAMGDAAARLFDILLGDNGGKSVTTTSSRTAPELKREELMRECRRHLLSTNPEEFWTSGQWSTEKAGGSDVSGTETVATLVKDFDYVLNGFKWFTSATDSQMTLALAKIKDEKTGKVDDNVSLFLIKMRDEKTQKLNGLILHKLKKKLGTKALPTAEIEIKNAKATLISNRGEGIKFISVMMNLTRIYNSICAVAKMRRMISIAQDFSSRRTVNRGQLLSHNPLHLRCLSKLVTEATASLHIVMDVVRLLGREECGLATTSETHILRLFTPIIKLYTGKRAIAVVSEGLEMIGGMGYIEDTGIPRLLRDAQVLSIWEGTTNILSLDVLRVVLHPRTGQDTVKSWVDRVHSILNSPSSSSNVTHVSKQISKALNDILSYLQNNSKNQTAMTTFARDLAFSIARVQISALLLEHCIARNTHKNVSILKQYVEDNTPLCILPSQEQVDQVKIINATDYLIGNESEGYKTPSERKSKL